MSNKRYYWLKLKEDFFQEDTIEWLEEQENGKDYCLFYLKLCLKSLKTDGLLIRNVGSMLVPYDAKTLAKITNTDIDTVRVAMELFKNIGLVQILENGEIFISQLKDMVGSETKWAEKKRIQRQKKDNVLLSEDNVLKLSGQFPTEKEKEKELDIDIDIDKEKDKEKDKESMSVGNSDLKTFKTLYEKNIGLISGMTAQYLIDISEIIDVKLFERAVEIANDRGINTLGYIKGIINKWLNSNITTLEQLEAYELQNQNRGTNNGNDTNDNKQLNTQIPADDEKDEEYYRLLEECNRWREYDLQMQQMQR